MLVQKGVQVIDKGWERIKRDILAQNGQVVRAGVLEGDSPVAEGVTVAEYAAYNEYGTSTIPERAFMRRAFDVNLAKYNSEVLRAQRAIVDGRMSPNAIGPRMGVMMRNDIVLSITSAKTWAQPNAEATVRRKGSSSPLIDTGALRASIDWEVVR